MGHKLPASRGSYFDYHDVDFARKNYLKASWSRIGFDRVKEMEENIDKIVEERVKTIENFYKREMEKGIGSLQKEMAELRKMMEEEQKPRLPKPPKVVTKEIKEIFKDAGRKTRKEA